LFFHGQVQILFGQQRANLAQYYFED